MCLCVLTWARAVVGGRQVFLAGGKVVSFGGARTEQAVCRVSCGRGGWEAGEE